MNLINCLWRQVKRVLKRDNSLIVLHSTVCLESHPRKIPQKQVKNWKTVMSITTTTTMMSLTAILWVRPVAPLTTVERIVGATHPRCEQYVVCWIHFVFLCVSQTWSLFPLFRGTRNLSLSTLDLVSPLNWRRKGCYGKHLHVAIMECTI